MEIFIRLSDRLSKAGGVLAGILMLIGVTMVLTEIVLRTLFNMTLYITEEYTGYLMVGITFLALAYTLRERGHIRMTFLHSALKGKARTALDIYTFAFGMAFFSIVTWTTAGFFWDSVVSHSRSMQVSATYLAIPQFFMPLGSFIMTLQFAAEMCRSIVKLRPGVVQEEEAESIYLGR